MPDATALNEQALQAQLKRAREALGGGMPGPSELLADRAAYLAPVEELC